MNRQSMVEIDCKTEVADQACFTKVFSTLHSLTSITRKRSKIKETGLTAEAVDGKIWHQAEA